MELHIDEWYQEYYDYHNTEEFEKEIEKGVRYYE